MSLPLPRPVRAGSRLAVVAPASPFDEDSFRSGVDWLRERYDVVHRPDVCSRAGYLAGTDERRLGELTDALADPSVDAVVCARGGYGTTRLLPGIDPALVRAANKLVVGFSDITALHALWGAVGVRSVHAPMVAALGRAPETVRQLWIDAVEHPERGRAWDLVPVREDRASARGILAGGNLAVLGALVGTPYCPPLAGRILFIEDVGERPYRVDRVLTSMKQAGMFRELAGLVVGAFTEGEPGPDGTTVEEVISGHFADAPFPVLTGFPAGHIEANEAIPFGAEASIEAGRLEIPEGRLPPS